MKYHLLPLLLLFCNLIACGQRFGHYYSATAGFGENVPHETRVKCLKSPYQVYNLRWGVHANGDKYWEQIYHYPTYGLGLSFANLNNQYLGQLYAAYFFMDFPILNNGCFSLKSDMAVGLAYYTHPFDDITNPKNVALSSHCEAKLELGLVAQWQLNKQWALNLWGGINHYSDGARTEPNAGLNCLLIKIGASYYLNDEELVTSIIPRPTLDRHSADVYGSIAHFELDNKTHNPFWAQVIQCTYNYRIGYKSKVGIGMDFINDPTTNLGSTHFRKHFRKAIVLSHELMMNKVSLLTQFAICVGSNINEIVYQRIALHYWFVKNMYVSTGLRTTWASADFVEVGFGYSFKWYKS